MSLCVLCMSGKFCIGPEQVLGYFMVGKGTMTFIHEKFIFTQNKRGVVPFTPSLGEVTNKKNKKIINSNTFTYPYHPEFFKWFLKTRANMILIRQ